MYRRLNHQFFCYQIRIQLSKHLSLTIITPSIPENKKDIPEFSRRMGVRFDILSVFKSKYNAGGGGSLGWTFE